MFKINKEKIFAISDNVSGYEKFRRYPYYLKIEGDEIWTEKNNFFNFYSSNFLYSSSNFFISSSSAFFHCSSNFFTASHFSLY